MHKAEMKYDLTFKLTTFCAAQSALLPYALECGLAL
jgi:hypothetical protein